MKGQMCYKFEFNVERDGEVNKCTTKVNMIAENYDNAIRKIKQWEKEQNIILRNFKCVDDFTVWL